VKVLHLCATTLDSHYFANLGEGSARRGIEIHAASLSEPTPPGWLEGAGGRYCFLDARSRASYPRAIRGLAAYLRRHQVDIVQTHLFDAAAVGIAAGKLARTPLVVMTRHHTDEMFIVGTRWHVMADRWMARAADRIVGFSHAVRNHMMRREGADGSKIEVIYQGFDFDALAATEQQGAQVRAEFGIGDHFVVGCVARFFKTKGHVYLMPAVRALAAQIPNLRLLLLGGGDRAAIEAMIRENGIEDRVIFTGYRRDVPACMRAMDVVVHPSLTEAFCQTVVEALAAGAPLVVTDVAAASEVVTHRETGMLIPPRDPDAIADAVLELYRDRAAMRRMADAGQRSVRARFTIDRMVDQQVDCYHRWLGEMRSGGRRAEPIAG
jgi:glycosyltransferase involved in cell wall biosynthesis